MLGQAGQHPLRKATAIGRAYSGQRLTQRIFGGESEMQQLPFGPVANVGVRGVEVAHQRGDVLRHVRRRWPQPFAQQGDCQVRVCRQLGHRLPGVAGIAAGQVSPRPFYCRGGRLRAPSSRQSGEVPDEDCPVGRTGGQPLAVGGEGECQDGVGGIRGGSAVGFVRGGKAWRRDDLAARLQVGDADATRFVRRGEEVGVG
jgi:hypothetical protein